MSAVIATPELMAQAATDLATIGSTVNAAHMALAAPTLSVLPAAADEVSAGIAHLFSGYAQDYQGLAGKAAAFHEQFVQHLTASAVSYASAEAVNVALLLQPLTAIVDSVASSIAALPGQLAFNLLTSINAVMGPNVGFLGPFAIPLFLIGLALDAPFILIPFLFFLPINIVYYAVYYAPMLLTLLPPFLGFP